MFSRNDVPRGSQYGGRGGRGGRKTSSRSRKRARDKKSAAETALERTSAAKEEGEIPPQQHQAGSGPASQSYANAAARGAHPTYYAPQTLASTTRDQQHRPQPFQHPPHLQITGQFSRKQTVDTELLFYKFFEPGLAATRELLQELRTIAAKEIEGQFGIKLPPSTAEADVVTIVTKRDVDQTTQWFTTGDIRVKFASPDQARGVFQRQCGQWKGNNTGALYTYNDHRCQVKIPDGTSRPPPEDRDLYRVFLGCASFRGETQLSVEQLLRDSIEHLWHQVRTAAARIDQEVDVDVDHISVLSRARQEADGRGEDYIQLRPSELLSLMEYSRVTKLAQASPFVALDYPETQIPLALKALVAEQDISIAIPILGEGAHLNFVKASVFDTNPASRGLDFDEDPDSKEDFLKFSVHFRCTTKTSERRNLPMPALEYISEGISIILNSQLQGRTPLRQAQKLLRHKTLPTPWFIEGNPTEDIDLGLNTHLGDNGLKTPGRIADTDGATAVIASFRSAVGAAISVLHHRFIIFLYVDDKKRLCLDKELTAGGTSLHGATQKIALTYVASAFGQSSLPNLKQEPTPSDRNAWFVSVASSLQSYAPVRGPQDEDIMDEEEEPNNEADDPMEPSELEQAKRQEQQQPPPTRSRSVSSRSWHRSRNPTAPLPR